MKEKYGLLIIIVQSVIIALLLVYLIFSVEETTKIPLYEARIADLQEISQTCKRRNDSLSVLLQQIRITNSIPPFLDNRQVRELVNKGLSDPVEDLRNHLISGPELISTSPMLGGRMGFYFRDAIHILNKRWVFAYFEDGHMAGAMLLRYEVEQDGSIIWEVLDETIY